MKLEDKIPSLAENDEDLWRTQLKDLRKEERLRILSNANFICGYIKSLDATQKEKATDKARRYDSIRKDYDIRNKDIKTLPFHQVSQILESQKDIDKVREMNKDLNLNAAELEYNLMLGSQVTAIVLKGESETGHKFLTHKEHIEHTYDGRYLPERYDWSKDPKNYKVDGHIPPNRCRLCGYRFVGWQDASFCNICDKAMSPINDDQMAILVKSDKTLVPRSVIVMPRIRIPDDKLTDDEWKDKVTGMYKAEFQTAADIATDG